MDELTIGDKIYISSKQAAKITGYAKDYVGQLCREGRVEARLVGRNWYVLEDSIREHRFGAPAASAEAAREPVEAPKESPVSSWEAPRYVAVAESPALPAFTAEKPIVAAPETVETVALMQDAWKEWFESRERAENTIPEEPVVEETPETESEEDTELADTEMDEVRASDMPNVYAVSEVSQEEEEGSPVSISRVEEEPIEYARPVVEQRMERVVREPRVAGSVIDLSRVYEEPQEEVVTYAAPIAPPRPRKKVKHVRTAGSRSSLALKAIILSFAGLAAVVAIIGSGTFDTLTGTQGANGGAQGFIFEALKGESKINK